MLSERTISRIRGLGLNANGYLTVCEIVQDAMDEARPAKQGVTALTVPGDWPADYHQQFWSRYPNKKDKADAMRALDKIAKAGKTRWGDLIAGLERYISSDDVQRGFVKHPATFINKGSWQNQEQTTPRRVERPKSFLDAALDFGDGTGTDHHPRA